MKSIIIKTKKMFKDYNTESNTVNVLNDINLEIYEGDFTVIMGNSGSGKSTLLYTLSSMDKPTKGEVQIVGKNISKLKEKQISEIRKKDIAFVFQSVNLIPDLTAFENIACPAYMAMSVKEANNKTIKLLGQFDLLEEADKYPNEMSGGQQQRIAVARAVISEPKILFADEPTGALNSSAGKYVLDLLTKYNNEGQSIVMVTHDIKACSRGNRLIYIKDGRVIGDLNLGEYNNEDQTIREDKVFNFLKGKGW